LRTHAPLGRRDAATRTAPRRGDDDLNPGLISPVAELVDAAVLVPLIRRESDLHVLLTRRTAHLNDHPGQIAFPGGRVEAWDASPEAAALREAEEEVGLTPRMVDIVGQLDTYLTRTGYRVTPIVGVMDPPGALRPDDFEVAEIFEVPLSFLRQPKSRQMHSQRFQGRERFFYVFPYGDYYIWGATAGMLVNLVDVLEQPC
jgi:8-oxo-dGTP pyrophosphatase MutT (NUDIX family)